MPQVDARARLQPKKFARSGSNDVLGPNNPANILYPLWQTNGVLFPYTPAVSTGNVVEYDQTPFVHTNYGYNAYVRSYPKPINLTADFTAQTTEEALYLLAVIWFFRSVTKSYFGINPYDKAGTPPPVLVFSYLGDYQFNNVPVIVKDFSYTLEKDVDYVPVNTAGLDSSGVGQKTPNLPAWTTDGWTYVPTRLSVSLDMDTQYIPIQLRDDFNLDLFRQGKLINKGYI
jgi:hypothetical protein